MQARFKTRVVGIDPSGYYYTKWGNAVPVTLLAANADEAIKKAKELMGTPTDCHYKEWTATIDEVIEEVEEDD